MHHHEVIKIAQQAWDKTKPAADPVWLECDAHHRQVFIATAQAVVDSGHAVNDFEAAVKRLAQEAAEKREVVEQVQAENPTAHSDEVQAIAAGVVEPQAVSAAPVGVASAEAAPAEAPKRVRKPAPKASKQSAKKGK